MREELLPFFLIGVLIAAFAVPAALLLLLERVPGLRPGDGPQPQGAHSRSGGAFMIAGGAAICILGLLSWSPLSIIAVPGVGLMLMGVSGFARDEHRSRWLDGVGMSLIGGAAVLLQWLLDRA